MSTIVHSATSEVRAGHREMSRPLPSARFVAMCGAVALILGVATLNFSARATGNGIALRCQASALAAVGSPDGYTGGARQWRQDRKVAFERCVDASFQPQQHLSP
jgi:hypothetical protein